MELIVITSPSNLPRRGRYLPFESVYYPTLAQAAARFREITKQEPGNIWEYTQVTPIGGARLTTRWFEWSMPKEPT